jgi:hypothetical protein
MNFEPMQILGSLIPASATLAELYLNASLSPPHTCSGLQKRRARLAKNSIFGSDYLQKLGASG